MNSERLSAIHKVSGGTKEQQEKIANGFVDEFLTIKSYKDEEREKTPEEKEIIESIVTELNTFLSQYGARPLELKDTHIHILDRSKMSQEAVDYLEMRFPTASGYYQKETQDIIVLGWKIISPLELAKVITHELIHFLGYNSVIIDEENKDGFKSHRTGLAVQPKNAEIPLTGMKYFNEINEAVTEELVRRFYARLRNISLLTEEYDKVMNVREKYSVPDIAAIRIQRVDTPQGPATEATLKEHAYPKFREKLNLLIREIYEKRKSDFASDEDVFAIFVKAAMTGEVKELATLIDSTLGVGTFKKIANLEDE